MIYMDIGLPMVYIIMKYNPSHYNSLSLAISAPAHSSGASAYSVKSRNAYSERVTERERVRERERGGERETHTQRETEIVRMGRESRRYAKRFKTILP